MNTNESFFKAFEFQNASFAYDNTPFILEDVSIQIPANKVVEVRGWQGAGRSSVLKLLAGLLIPNSGSYLINNQRVEEMSFEEFIEYRLKIGFSFEYGGLINNKTIRENLELPLVYHNRFSPEEIEVQVDNIIEEFCLKRDALKRPSAISGSTRKSAIVARAFLMNPEVLILDNPTTGLNSYNREHLRDKIKLSREEGKIPHIFLATDDREFAEGLVEEELVIENKMLYLRPPEIPLPKEAAV
ncbi:MAG: ATP-binding cassette domain-containing protein [Bdellovibrionales bacterium]|nr:ATP-binding cassette domain-containing protein [Bdellovibrionales bacterium]